MRVENVLCSFLHITSSPSCGLRFRQSAQKFIRDPPGRRTFSSYSIGAKEYSWQLWSVEVQRPVSGSVIGIGFLNAKKSKNRFCVSLLNRYFRSFCVEGTEESTLEVDFFQFLFDAPSKEKQNPFSDSLGFKNPIFSERRTMTCGWHQYGPESIAKDMQPCEKPKWPKVLKIKFQQYT